MPSGSAGGTVKEWKYERVMSFLLPHMQTRSSKTTLQLEDEPVDMSLVEEDVDPEICQLSRPYSPLIVIQRPATPALENQICLTPTAPPATSTPPLSTQIADPPAHPRVQTIVNEGRQRQKRRRVASPSPTEQQLLDIITQPTTTAPPQVPRQEDEMYYFALSLVPKLNRLHPRNQNRAQIHILNYLANLEDENQRPQATQAGPVFSHTQSPQTTGFQPISYHEVQTHHPHHMTPPPTTSYHQHGSEQDSSHVYHQFP
ncbi:hypothetical protein R3I94_004831 [Phoxinus phoxinus]|uniref:BESS domain-containing protein n=1 Tax=Phoxinus phoxinus TaxID=58324 RepID=A0AAN9D418_9TELE